MRQQLLTKPSTSSRRSIGRQRRKERAALKSKNSSGIAVTPVRGFLISLMFLAPMAALGTLCFALVQNNLKLHQKNNKLTGMANEVRAEIDLLSEEIEALRERAGVADEEAAEISIPSEDDTSASATTSGDLIEVSDTEIDEAEKSVKTRLPRGGVASKVDALDLLKDAKAQVPVLNKALDSAAEPLEATLAAEAAYPNGLPMPGHLEVSSEYGVRGNPFGGHGYEMHEGIDFIGDEGDIIAATGEGKVTMAGPNGGYGNSVTIDHGHGYETLYAHMSKVKVKVGDRVKRGQIVGHMGSTGRSSGTHLHYAIYKDEKAINPRQLMTIPENRLALGAR